MAPDWLFRRMEVDDLPALMAIQEPAAVAGLSDIFPQEEHPFPRDDVRGRWDAELQDPAIAAYVALTRPCDRGSALRFWRILDIT